MKDPLARFYTETIFSNLLINNLVSNKPNSILDLGFGIGSLTNAAYKRWADASYYAIDIEERESTYSYENLKLFQANILTDNIPKVISKQYGSFDIAICNPPYIKLKKNNKCNSILRKASFKNSLELSYYTSDLIFLAYNLLFIKDGGEIGIILPDGLLTSKDFYKFRIDLINNFQIRSVIQLPDNIFKKTEARTHIIFLVKKKPIDNKTELRIANANFTTEDAIIVDQTFLAERMDYNYQKWRLSYENKPDLNSLGVEIKRGSYTHKELRSLGIEYFHTTDFSEKYLSFKDIDLTAFENKVVAKKGDILIARVGKRCIGKLALVASGSMLISDCVYRLRVPEKYIHRVWLSLNSPESHNWFKVFAHGVCSQVISKHDLSRMPVGN